MGNYIIVIHGCMWCPKTGLFVLFHIAELADGQVKPENGGCWAWPKFWVCPWEGPPYFDWTPNLPITFLLYGISLSPLGHV